MYCSQKNGITRIFLLIPGKIDNDFGCVRHCDSNTKTRLIRLFRVPTQMRKKKLDTQIIRVFSNRYILPYSFNIYIVTKWYNLQLTTLTSIVSTGVREAARSQHGAVVRDPAQPGKVVRRLFRDDHGEGVARAEVRHSAQLQPLLLPDVHPQVAQSQAIRQ